MHVSAVLSVPISTLKRGHLSGARRDFYLQTETLARLSACAFGFVTHRFLARGRNRNDWWLVLLALQKLP